MTREEFLGRPIITRGQPTASFTPKLTPDADAAEAQPFRDGMTIRRGARTFVVMDGLIPVASYNGHVLMVAEHYRGRGIATDLVYDFRTRHPEVPPATIRTPGAQRVQEKVWARLEMERA